MRRPDFQSPTYRGTQWNRRRLRSRPRTAVSFQSPTYRGTQWNPRQGPAPTGPCGLSVPYLPGNTVERRVPTPGLWRRSCLSVPYLPGNTVELRLSQFMMAIRGCLSVPYLPGNTVELRLQNQFPGFIVNFQSPTYRGTQWN